MHKYVSMNVSVMSHARAACLCVCVVWNTFRSSSTSETASEHTKHFQRWFSLIIFSPDKVSAVEWFIGPWVFWNCTCAVFGTEFMTTIILRQTRSPCYWPQIIEMFLISTRAVRSNNFLFCAQTFGTIPHNELANDFGIFLDPFEHKQKDHMHVKNNTHSCATETTTATSSTDSQQAGHYSQMHSCKIPLGRKTSGENTMRVFSCAFLLEIGNYSNVGKRSACTISTETTPTEITHDLKYGGVMDDCQPFGFNLLCVCWVCPFFLVDRSIGRLVLLLKITHSTMTIEWL